MCHLDYDLKMHMLLRLMFSLQYYFFRFEKLALKIKSDNEASSQFPFL